MTLDVNAYSCFCQIWVMAGLEYTFAKLIMIICILSQASLPWGFFDSDRVRVGEELVLPTSSLYLAWWQQWPRSPPCSFLPSQCLRSCISGSNTFGKCCFLRVTGVLYCKSSRVLGKLFLRVPGAWRCCYSISERPWLFLPLPLSSQGDGKRNCSR